MRGNIEKMIKVNYQPYIKHKIIADMIIEIIEIKEIKYGTFSEMPY
jgi:hypothetical protein